MFLNYIRFFKCNYFSVNHLNNRQQHRADPLINYKRELECN